MRSDGLLALGTREFLVVGLGQRGSDAHLVGFAEEVGIGRLGLR